MNQKTFYINVCILLLLFFLIDFGISKIFLIGLNKFYGFDKKAEILINGSSMTISGFNKTDIENQTKNKIALFAKEGVSVDDRYAMIKYFLLEHQRTRTILYEVNPLIFSGISTADNVYTLFYPYMDNPAIDEYIRKNADYKEYYINKIIRCKRYDVLLLNFILKGYMGNYKNFKTAVMDTTQLSYLNSQTGKMKVLINQDKLEVFNKTIKLIDENKTKTLLIMMPIYYKKNLVFDSLSYNNLLLFFKNYHQINPDVEFIDLNKGYLTTNASLYSDPLHLNINGQKEVTKEIVKLLNKYTK